MIVIIGRIKSKISFAFLILIAVIFSFITNISRLPILDNIQETFNEQSEYDMALINTYLNSIQAVSDKFYEQYFNVNPTIFYYNVEIKNVFSDKSNSIIIFKSQPFVGPHYTVGVDEISFEADYTGNIKLREFNHIISYSLPDHLKNLIKKPLPGAYK